MAIPFQCGACGFSGRAKETMAGKITKCPKCGEIMKIRDAPPIEDDLSDLENMIEVDRRKRQRRREPRINSKTLAIVFTVLGLAGCMGLVVLTVMEAREKEETAAVVRQDDVAPPEPTPIEPKQEESAPVASKKERSGFEAYQKIENEIATAPNWAIVKHRDGDDDKQSYGHTSGIRVTFWLDSQRSGRVRLTYDPSDEHEKNMATVFWLLVPGIASNDTEYDENSDRISEWLGDPVSILVLNGGFVHAKAEHRRAEIDLYIPNAITPQDERDIQMLQDLLDKANDNGA